MILDKIDNFKEYLNLEERFRAAFSFLNPRLALLTSGKYEFREGIYVMVIESSQLNKAGLECHKRYIDIHYTLLGTDKIGVKLSPTELKQQYNEEDDTTLYADVPEQILEVKENEFALFFPGEAHFSLMSEKKIKKVVVKIPV